MHRCIRNPSFDAHACTHVPPSAERYVAASKRRNESCRDVSSMYFVSLRRIADIYSLLIAARANYGAGSLVPLANRSDRNGPRGSRAKRIEDGNRSFSARASTRLSDTFHRQLARVDTHARMYVYTRGTRNRWTRESGDAGTKNADHS